MSLAIARAVLAASAPPASGGTATVVQMTDSYFAPKKLTIKVGGTVEWVNGGAKVHSVSTEKAAALDPKHVATPKGAAPFNSGFIPPGGNYSYTFKVPGTYRYFCLPHEKDGMVGEVAVKK